MEQMGQQGGGQSQPHPGCTEHGAECRPGPRPALVGALLCNFTGKVTSPVYTSGSLSVTLVILVML